MMQTQMDRVGVATGREKSTIAMRAFDGVPGLGDSLNRGTMCIQQMIHKYRGFGWFHFHCHDGAAFLKI